jgi:hypothetical protein
MSPKLRFFTCLIYGFALGFALMVPQRSAPPHHTVVGVPHPMENGVLDHSRHDTGWLPFDSMVTDIHSFMSCKRSRSAWQDNASVNTIP